MPSSESSERIRAACKRYGPGRLPEADRPAIGAGYAGAAAALIAALQFSTLVFALERTGRLAALDGEALAAIGLVAVPVVVPAAFVSGVVSWRVLPAEFPFFGVVAGLVATLGTYVGATLAFGAVVVLAAAASRTSATIANAAAFSVLVGWAAFAFTAWVTVPVGCLSGAVYDRVGRESRAD